MSTVMYALSVPSLGLSGAFDGAAVSAAMKGKVFAHGELLGMYSMNPECDRKAVEVKARWRLKRMGMARR